MYLAAELLRDSALQASGLLARTLGVPSVRPPQPARLAGRYRPASVSAPEAATWVALARTLLNLDEFITRE